MLLCGRLLELLNDLIGLTPLARVGLDGLNHIVRTTVVQEVYPLSETPQRGRAELIRSGRTRSARGVNIRYPPYQGMACINASTHGQVPCSALAEGDAGQSQSRQQQYFTVATGLCVDP